MPTLVLADAAGQAIDFTHQSIAGDTVLLWVSDDRNGWQPLPELEALTDQFAMLEAQLFAVAARMPVPAEPDGQVRLAFDPDRKLRAMFGLERGGVIVVEPHGRVAAVLPGPAFDAALAVCRSLHGRSEPSLRRGGAPVLLLPDVLERGLCEELIAYWAAGRKHEDLVSSGREAQDTGQRLKRRADVMLQDKGLFGRVRQRLMTRVVTEMRKVFCFSAASFEPLRIGCYDGARGGYFGRHRDNRTPYTAHRSFAMSLNLNTGAYVGGQIRFPEFGRELYEADAGGAVVFSCNLLHEALPVTSGRRFALFTFFADAVGAAREKEMTAQRLASGHRGVSVG
jgi:predicted 2-oxoglutarate/Fe(II)-dependent dioxygenase YbiX